MRERRYEFVFATIRVTHRLLHSPPLGDVGYECKNSFEPAGAVAQQGGGLMYPNCVAILSQIAMLEFERRRLSLP